MRTGQIDLLDLELPLTLRPSSRYSDEQLMVFSELNKPYRIERNKDGDITIMTPVTGIGGTNEMYVSRIFSNWVEQDGRGIDFSPNTGFNLPDGATCSPDAAWIPRESWNALTAEQQDSFVPLCPHFLIEVRSKSDRRSVVESKMRQWIENGAQLAWLVDPIEASVTIYRPGQDPETLDRPESVTASDPVAGFTLPCTRLWPAV